MSTYIYETKSRPFISGLVSAKTSSKAKYKIWLEKGASDYYESFRDFIKDIKIRKLKESEGK